MDSWRIQINLKNDMCPFIRYIDNTTRCGRNDYKSAAVIRCQRENCPFILKDSREGA